MNRVISIITMCNNFFVITQSDPRYILIVIHTLSDEEFMLMMPGRFPQLTVTQARPRVARAQPSSSFPGLCVYTQVRLLHILFFPGLMGRESCHG